MSNENGIKNGNKSNSQVDQRRKTGPKNTNSSGNKKQGRVDSGKKPKENKPSKPKVTKTKKDPLFRVRKLHKELNALQNMKIRLENDNFIVESISGTRSNAFTLWKPGSIRWALTIASLTKKCEYPNMVTKISDEQLQKDFIETQIEPILSPSIVSKVFNKFCEVFDDFPYDELERKLKSHIRVKLITQGSSWPSNLAPVYHGENSNAELLAGMKLGMDIFLPGTDLSEVFVPPAGGKFTTVPKNKKSNRGITIAPADLIDLHDVASTMIRDWLTVRSRTSHHIIQFDDQTVQHNNLIEGYATIDLSSASDRVYKRLINRVWPEFYDRFSYLFPKDVLLTNGRIVPLTCVGTQGFPLTFTLMSAVAGLLTEAVKLTHLPSSNYGDDIIVSEKDFEEVYCGLESIGLKINRLKTHVSSDGYIESCGMDIMFSKHGPRNVTPIYLRGVEDVNFIEFFNQLTEQGMIAADDATSIMSRLNVDFYAFEHDYSVTEFHFRFGPVKGLQSPSDFVYNSSQHEVQVPYMEEFIDGIKGLSKRNSEIVLKLLDIDSRMKDANINEKFVRKGDPVPRQYRLQDLENNEFYELYLALSNAEGLQVVSYVMLSKEYKLDIRVIFYYVFITTEMRNYRYSSTTVDFSEYTVNEFDYQELMRQVHGIVQEIKYPIFRYRSRKSLKKIRHPLSSLHLDIEASDPQ